MAKTKKNLIKDDLKAKMMQKNLTSPLYESLLDQYMSEYDQLCELKSLISSAENSSQYIGYSNEARQLQKSMLGILGYLGISPTSEPATNVEDDYEL